MNTLGFLRSFAAVAALLAPMAIPGQSILPNAPQPADLPLPAVFTVGTIGYQALPPNDHYSSVALATGDGETFGTSASVPFSFNSETPQNITLNFGNPIQLQFGDSPGNVLGVDSVSGNSVGESIKGRGYIATPSGRFAVDPTIPSPPVPNTSFIIGYPSVFTGMDQGHAVGTARVTVGTQILLTGGETASGPQLHYQFPIFSPGLQERFSWSCISLMKTPGNGQHQNVQKI